MPAKEKSKRKRGKKFSYDPTSKSKEELVKSQKSSANPFEAYASKKFMKTSQYGNLRKEFNSAGNSNFIVDRRIGENSKNLTEEDKQKLRFKAQQLINLKKKQNKYDVMTPSANDNSLQFTHKGKTVNEANANDSDDQGDDDDYELDIANQLLQESTEGLSKKDQHLQLVEKARVEREAKRKERLELKEKTKLLDDNFAEINALLSKRKRDYESKNDPYYKNINIYQYADKTTPTTRIKTEEEIEKDKQKKLEKLRQKEEESEEESVEEVEEDDTNKKLTKKERIGKLIEKRLMKAESLRLKSKDDNNLVVSTKKTEEDGMSDLDEGESGDEQNEEEDEENEEGEEYDEENEEGDEGDEDEE